jgi:hypothetical protein
VTPRLVVVLAANGLGHTRRMVGILGAYLDRGGVGEITIVGTPWQREAAKGWTSGARVEHHGATWRHGIVEDGVRWSTAPDRYRDGSLVGWEERLAGVPELEDADVVVSDNLVGVLTRRPDALLAASFLWSDVLASASPATPEVTTFVEHERALLAEHRPEMLCVRDLAMPGVWERTRAHPVGWMCPEPATEPAGGSRVAVLGGRTGEADEMLAAVAGAVGAAGFDVAAGDAIGGSRTSPFDGSPAAWRSVGAVVCRPGAGTLTDCVQWRVPMVCIDEGDNAEMAHNAARMEAVGFGVDGGRTPAPEAVVAAVQRLAAPKAAREARQQLARADRRGLEQAADWLAVHCRVSLRSPAAHQGEGT